MKLQGFYVPVPRWVRNKLRAAFPLHPRLRRAIWESGLLTRNEEWFRFQVRTKNFPYEILAAAIRDGDFHTLRLLVQLGIDPLTLHECFNESPLFTAAKMGRSEMVQFFLDRGVSPSIEDTCLISALHWAVDSGSLDTVRTLVHAGADLWANDGIHFTTPLGYAVMKDDLEMIQLLVEMMAAAEEEDDDREDEEDDEDYLRLAAEYGAIQAFDFFYAREELKDGEKLLNCAVRSGSFPMLEHLLQYDELDFHPKRRSEQKESAAGDLLSQENEQKEEEKDEAKEEEERIQGLFLQALGSGSARIFHFLQSEKFGQCYGKPIHFDVKNPESVVYAVQGHNPRLLWKVLEEGGDPNATDTNGRLPLCSLNFGVPISMAQILLFHGADPNRKDGSGKTPLTSVCSSYCHKSYPLARLLLKNGAKVNTENEGGNTPLLVAIESKKSLQLIRLLVESGAALETCSAEGEPPLTLAQKKGRPKLVRYLRHRLKIQKYQKSGSQKGF